jgi:hypothetical protein
MYTYWILLLLGKGWDLSQKLRATKFLRMRSKQRSPNFSRKAWVGALLVAGVAVVSLPQCVARRTLGSSQSSVLPSVISNAKEAADFLQKLSDLADQYFFYPKVNNPERVGVLMGDLATKAEGLGLINTTGLRYEFKAKRTVYGRESNPFDLLASYGQLMSLPAGERPILSSALAGQLWSSPDGALDENLFTELQQAARDAAAAGSPVAAKLQGRDTKGMEGSIPVTRTEYRYSGEFVSTATRMAKAAPGSATAVSAESERGEKIKIRVRNYYDAVADQPAMAAAHISAIGTLLPDFASMPVKFWEYKTTDGEDILETKSAVKVRKYRLPVYAPDVRILSNETALEYAAQNYENQPNLTRAGEYGKSRDSLKAQVLGLDSTAGRQAAVALIRAAGKSAKPGAKVSLVQAILARPDVQALFKDPFKPTVPLLAAAAAEQGQDPARPQRLGERFAAAFQKGTALVQGVQRSVGTGPESDIQAMQRWILGFWARTYVLTHWHSDFLKPRAFDSNKSVLVVDKERAMTFTEGELGNVTDALQLLAAQSYQWTDAMVAADLGLFQALEGLNSFPTQYIMEYKRLSFSVFVPAYKEVHGPIEVQITLDQDIRLMDPVGERFKLPGGSYLDNLDFAFPESSNSKIVMAEVKFPAGTQTGLEASPFMSALYRYRDKVVQGSRPLSSETSGKNNVAVNVLETAEGRAARVWALLNNWREMALLGYTDLQYNRLEGFQPVLKSLLEFNPFLQSTAMQLCNIWSSQQVKNQSAACAVSGNSGERLAPDKPL